MTLLESLKALLAYTACESCVCTCRFRDADRPVIEQDYDFNDRVER